MFSGFVFENIHCIDIETIEGHQGRKLAQKIAHSFVKDCLENDIIPYWDCMELNKPSVAENVGFTNVFNYVGYYFYLNNLGILYNLHFEIVQLLYISTI